jgi:GT2 family glycosyltransferase
MQQAQFFSIVIPTYNRPERLDQCLRSLAMLDYPRNCFEVIVVDDGSPTSMERITTPYQQQLNLMLIRQTNAGPAKARNVGAMHAKGQFLVFTDDDCMPASNWLTALATRVATNPDCLIGGQALNALPDNLYSTASQVLIDYLYSYYNSRPQSSTFFASNNLAVPTDRFHQLSGFDTSFPLAAGEDREFCDRWLQQGYKMIYAPEVQVYHAHHLTLKAFWRQHFNYGRGAYCFHSARAKRTQESIRVEPLTFYFNLLKYPFGQSASQQAMQQAMPLSMLLFISQVANITGFFKEKIKVRL